MVSHPIDVHILVMPDTDQLWMTECLESLSDEPVNIHICEGIKGDIAAARSNAFSKGSCKYVSFIDPDDAVIPGTFTLLEEALEASPEAVMAYSDEILVDKNGNQICQGWSTDPSPYLRLGYNIRCHNINGEYIHHLRLMRRDAVEKCLPLKTKRMPEPVLMRELSRLGKIMHLPVPGYKWRIHEGNTFSTYTQTEHDEALCYIQ